MVWNVRKTGSFKDVSKGLSLSKWSDLLRGGGSRHHLTIPGYNALIDCTLTLYGQTSLLHPTRGRGAPPKGSENRLLGSRFTFGDTWTATMPNAFCGMRMSVKMTDRHIAHVCSFSTFMLNLNAWIPNCAHRVYIKHTAIGWIKEH